MLILEQININKLNKLSNILSSLLEPSDMVGLTGELGAGKTTFIKSLSSHFGVSQEKVVSPTFILLQSYEGTHTLYHWDLYRLQDEKELLALDYEEYFYGAGICLVEWFDKLNRLKPSHYILIHFQMLPNSDRKICITGEGEREKKMISEIEKRAQQHL